MLVPGQNSEEEDEMKSYVGALLLGLAVAACGGEGEPSSSQDSDPSGSGGASSGGAGASTDGVGIATSCDPACPDGEHCSVTGVCLPEGQCAVDEDCAEGLICDPASLACTPGGGCGGLEVALETVPPNLLIVLDRSCSMRRDLNNNINVAGPNKWTYSVDAITELTLLHEGEMRFGLTLFPDRFDGSQCKQGAASIPVGPGNESAIQSMLASALDTNDAYYPDGPCVTNIDTALEQASLQPELVDPKRANYVVLITDGKQAGCSAAGGDSGSVSILTQMSALGISTFVVGFGGGTDVQQMSAFAVAGGVPKAGPEAYYQANDALELVAALETIAKETLPCAFELDEVPPSVDDVYVFVENDPTGVPRDPTHQDGWDYDSATNQIELYGPTCDAIKNGDIDDIDVVFGCDAPTAD